MRSHFMLGIEQNVRRVTKASKLCLVTGKWLICLLAFAFISTSVKATVATGFENDGTSFISNNSGLGGITLFREGYTELSVVIRDDSPISIDFSGLSWTKEQDEYFDILVWNLTGTYLTDLNLLWEKESINIDFAPKDPSSLGLIFLARGFSIATVKDITHGSDFYNFWLDFPNEVGYGVIKIGFNWRDFNTPIDDFSLHIGINGTKLYDDINPIPVPASIWYFGTSLLGFFPMFRGTAWLKNCLHPVKG